MLDRDLTWLEWLGIALAVLVIFALHFFKDVYLEKVYRPYRRRHRSANESTLEKPILMGASWRFAEYTRYHADWDHDHCEMCGAKLMAPSDLATWDAQARKDILTQGYEANDRYNWVCEPCFEKHSARCKWKLEGQSK